MKTEDLQEIPALCTPAPLIDEDDDRRSVMTMNSTKQYQWYTYIMKIVLSFVPGNNRQIIKLERDHNQVYLRNMALGRGNSNSK